ncbi:hypothetical protein [Sinomonas humi]|uniref:Uncharacterized protein n=1 Tax=Sinomonas humi TaxID=1338436 RepID=A0A0B2AAY7_9MICC|nr:hypothetical protein [Sinomonas humi]KHL00305.1 hypothetical protein LK10_20315 [Sinomonas humi]
MPDTNARPQGAFSKAGRKAAHHRTVTINFEGLGSVRLPPVEDLGFVGGVGVLATAGILEWPLAGILAAGHLLARSSRSNALKEFGDALEEV